MLIHIMFVRIYLLLGSALAYYFVVRVFICLQSTNSGLDFQDCIIGCGNSGILEVESGVAEIQGHC